MTTAFLILIIACFSGCGQSRKGALADLTQEQAETATDESSALEMTPGMTNLADSLDRALIRQIDEKHHRILLYSSRAEKSYVLSYDSSTTIQDKYGQQLVAGQLQTGDMVYAAFLKNQHLAKGFWIDPEMEKTENIQHFAVHIASGTMEIADEPYALSKNCLVLSKGEMLDLSDINESDTLTAVGYGKEIHALVISRGHGYVRLVGADAFEDGFVEFGQNVIRKVEKDALYVVPEGTYQMTISKGEDEGVKEIEVFPNAETEVDVSDILTEKDKLGQIIFTITPTQATLKVDDEEKDYSSSVELCYGIHKVEVSAEGYKSVTQYIRVGAQMANLSIDLEQQDSKDTEQGASEGSVSDNKAVYSAGAQGEYKVYIDGPAQAELYVDDIYIGVVPTSFAKTAGKHTISLRRDGYINRSYTLEIDNGENDNHYSFSSLKPSTDATTSGDLAKNALSSLLSDSLSGL